MLAARIRLLVAALWAGGLWTVSCQVIVLFRSLPRAEAGAFAGRLFTVESWLAIACGIVLIAMIWNSGEVKLDADRRLRRKLLAIVAAMLACSLLSQFGLQPLIRSMSEQAFATGVPLGAAFGIVHGGAGLIYLVQSVLAGWLLLKLK